MGVAVVQYVVAAAAAVFVVVLVVVENVGVEIIDLLRVLGQVVVVLVAVQAIAFVAQ